MKDKMSEILSECKQKLGEIAQEIAKESGDKSAFVRELVRSLAFGTLPNLAASYENDYEIQLEKCLQKGDWQSVNNLIFELTRCKLMPGCVDGYDHCGRFFTLLKSLACGDFKAVEAVIPRGIAPSANGHAMLVVGINLLAAIWHDDECALKPALAAAVKFANSKKPLNERAMIKYLIALCEQDASAMSESLQSFCASYVKTDVREGEKLLCLSAHGLYKLAFIKLPAAKFECVKMPTHKSFSREFAVWRTVNKSPELKLYFNYCGESQILGKILAFPPAVSTLYQPYLNSDNPYHSATLKKTWFLDDEAMTDKFAKDFLAKFEEQINLEALAKLAPKQKTSFVKKMFGF
ncbi:MAG: hypothetical protein LUC34_02025 [Campylobacter sp.]|nr:hypothetical protein [Campylobacter sp.]